MSGTPQAGFPSGAKKAVHVKWAGKTIALGTFPAAEADEKCARAKALTRAWRSSMRPKPTREWVMVELERLGVRVVSGRLGRKAGDEADDHDKSKPAPSHVPAQISGGPADRNNSLGWGASDADLGTLMARRNSLGLSMMNDAGRRGSLGSLGQVVGLDADPSLGLGGDFQNSGEQQRRNSSLGLGSLGGGSGLGGMGMSVNPNQHYEMLKLHHMNLLNEIQETTLMMNLYQQQQLQQQQQQLQQGGPDIGGNDPQIAMLLQQQQNQSGMDPMFGAAQLQQQQRASLGLGGAQLSGNFNNNMMPNQMTGAGAGGTSNTEDSNSQSAGKKDNTADASSDNKRNAESGSTDNSKKRAKTDTGKSDSKS